MMSQLMWTPPKIGQVSKFMWIFSVGQAVCLTLCGFYDVYSNDRKPLKTFLDTFGQHA